MTKVKLHLGCGERDFGSDWIHIDKGKYKHLDYQCDVYNVGQYIENESVDLIYASHVIAYFTREEAVNLLKRWHDLLKPNGIVRLATPDFNAMVELYVYGDYTLESFLGPLYGKMMVSNRGFEIFHKMVYDFGTLEKVLTEAGYKDVKTYDWRETEHAQFDDHSQAYLPHMDKKNGKLISLNVEARK
jgi:predicted SAM-dependent methyltransferase